MKLMKVIGGVPVYELIGPFVTSSEKVHIKDYFNESEHYQDGSQDFGYNDWDFVLYRNLELSPKEFLFKCVHPIKGEFLCLHFLDSPIEARAYFKGVVDAMLNKGFDRNILDYNKKGENKYD